MICNQINCRQFCRPEFLIVKINLLSLNHKQSKCNSGFRTFQVLCFHWYRKQVIWCTVYFIAEHWNWYLFVYFRKLLKHHTSYIIIKHMLQRFPSFFANLLPIHIWIDVPIYSSTENIYHIFLYPCRNTGENPQFLLIPSKEFANQRTGLNFGAKT